MFEFAHNGHGALANERDGHGVGADAVARDAAGGMGGVGPAGHHPRSNMSQGQNENLWAEARALFEPHRMPIDRDGQAALNRIAAKCLRFSFDSTTCAIWEEALTLDDLNRLEVFHRDAKPGREVEPIVVLSFKGKRYVIDGNKRVNAWRATGKPQTRRAIVIEPTHEGYANWLMPARS